MLGEKKVVVWKEGNAWDNVIDLDSCSDSTGTPPSPIYCAKNVETMREIEKIKDCFILDFDPDCPSLVSDLARKFENLDAQDICVIAEKGQMACRDYPHSRHDCVKYPFGKTPHEDHCELCYCFICDITAPCKFWASILGGHCHADEGWEIVREDRRSKAVETSR